MTAHYRGYNPPAAWLPIFCSKLLDCSERIKPQAPTERSLRVGLIFMRAYVCARALRAASAEEIDGDDAGKVRPRIDRRARAA